MGILAAPDLPAVEGLVKGLDGSDDVIRDVQRFVEAGRDPLGDGATPLSAVVAKCAGQVVGVAVLRQEEVDPAIKYRHVHTIHTMLNQYVQCHDRYVYVLVF